MAINDGVMLRNLTEVANRIAQTARQDAPTQRISENIEVGEAKISGDGYEIDIKIDLKKAPEARAFEFGSGIHSTKGPRETYVIAPRTGRGALAIPLYRWQNFEFPVIPGPKMIGLGDRGLVVSHVDHPGVEAQPYMTPAILDNLNEIKAKISEGVRAILLTGNRVEVVK